ncbi:trypsin-like serine protease [Photobacterium phosphoreum]|uniref:trypsin-like serine protease n=1 Tax=Photobacterium phosphoreum TaxID=659 RepID=UPI001E4534FE|nr:trypsin-like serine protease [Photobacterium phosphoreum]MCD9504062.1 trypsin-like serine protease [Photobacterium phosphoreum]
MKKQLSFLALSITSLFSISSYAVEGGTSISWKEHPYLVESQCTGTVLAGKYVLLAGHCADSVESPFPRLVNFADGSNVMPIYRNTLYKPELPASKFADIALWTLPKSASMDKVVFIDDLNNAVNVPQLNDEVTIMGFGQNDSTPRLEKITNSITSTLYPEIYIYGHATQHTIQGDSGAPVFNAANRIISTIYSGSGSNNTATGLYEQNGVNLRFVKDWLLTGINAWHSPTELKFTGSKTIEIQSLHVNPTNLADRQNTGILTTGDINVTGGTCVTDGDVAPFGTCTLELQAGNNEGHVQLEDGNTITINRTPEPKPEPQPQPEGGKSGGSMGWLGLLGLLAFAFKRK